FTKDWPAGSSLHPQSARPRRLRSDLSRPRIAHLSTSQRSICHCPILPLVYSRAVSDVTRILTALEQGDAKASNELLPLVYNELRRMAAHKMAAEPAGHTLQPTALVHEAWLKLVDSPSPSWQNRAHFFGAAAEAMRRILIDHAREKLALRR